MTRTPLARTRVRVAARPRPPLAWLVLPILALLLLAAGAARSQEVFPRIGLSASQDHHVDRIVIDPDSTFTIYAMAFGNQPGMPMDQPVTSLHWVIHQVCCGAAVQIVDMELNPDLEHEGHPLAGMVSSAPTCLDQDAIWLASMTVRVAAPFSGDYLWAAGPFGAAQDCDGGSPFFMDLPITVSVEGDVLPNDQPTFGSLKARFR
ncbi:hypothetical protein KDM41_10250 [bacterium]|nr:hypothetical protein [bacterium]